VSDPCASIVQTLAFLEKQEQTLQTEIAKAAKDGRGYLVVLEGQLRSVKEGIVHFTAALTQCRAESKP